MDGTRRTILAAIAGAQMVGLAGCEGDPTTNRDSSSIDNPTESGDHSSPGGDQSTEPHEGSCPQSLDETSVDTLLPTRVDGFRTRDIQKNKRGEGETRAKGVFQYDETDVVYIYDIVRKDSEKDAQAELDERMAARESGEEKDHYVLFRIATVVLTVYAQPKARQNADARTVAESLAATSPSLPSECVEQKNVIE